MKNSLRKIPKRKKNHRQKKIILKFSSISTSSMSVNIFALLHCLFMRIKASNKSARDIFLHLFYCASFIPHKSVHIYIKKMLALKKITFSVCFLTLQIIRCRDGRCFCCFQLSVDFKSINDM